MSCIKICHHRKPHTTWLSLRRDHFRSPRPKKKARKTSTRRHTHTKERRSQVGPPSQQKHPKQKRFHLDVTNFTPNDQVQGINFPFPVLTTAKVTPYNNNLGKFVPKNLVADLNGLQKHTEKNAPNKKHGALRRKHKNER